MQAQVEVEVVQLFMKKRKKNYLLKKDQLIQSEKENKRK